MTATMPARRVGDTRIDGRLLVIEQLAVDDPDLIAGAQAAKAAGQDLTSWVLTVLRAGAIAVTAAGRTADVTRMRDALDGVASTVDGVARSIDATVGAALTKLEAAVGAAVDPERGQIALASQAAITRLAQGVHGLLSGPDATVPARIQAAVARAGDQAIAEITRALAAQAAATQVLVVTDRDALRASVLAGVHDQVAHLGEQYSALAQMVAEVHTAIEVGRAVKQVPPGSADKGATYEACCHAMLSGIATAAGDGGADLVGNTAGQDGDKVGDLVVQFTSLGAIGPRLVVEAKARVGNKLTVTAWRNELARARSNRAAVASMGICPADTMPVANQRIVVLGDNAILVGWDPGDDDQVVVAAYLLLRLTAGVAGSIDGDDIDITEVRRLLAALRADLVPIDHIDRHAGVAEKAVGKIRETATALRSALIERIQALETTITAR